MHPRMLDNIRFLSIAGLSLCALCALCAQAQIEPAKDFPNKPIRFLVHSPPGGGTDTTARAIAQKLSDAWGRPVVLDNRTGASGAIAVDLAAKAVPDGYTICTIAATHTVDAAVNSRLPYDLTRDIAAISQTSSLYYVFYLMSSIPVKSIKELVTYSKANDGKVFFGTSGTGSLPHMAGEILNYRSGARLVHVPFKGAAASLSALLAGDVQAGFGSLIAVRPHLSNGRLRALAITARERSPAVPELPTIAEAGVPGYEVDQWYGVITGAKVPRAVIKKLHAGIAEALNSPDVVRRLAADGSTATGSSPEAFDAHIKSEIARWRKLVKEANLVLS